MSSEKGNVFRSRPQKHKNKTVFKNNLHDTSHTIKQINSLQINNVCSHCKGVIEWKIKYKKYKPLKAAATCVKCHSKSVKHAYHTICLPCAGSEKVCPKCGKSENLIQSTGPADDSFLQTSESQVMIKKLAERRRRTFNRYVKKTLSLSADAFEDGESAESLILAKLTEMALSSKKSDEILSDDDYDEDDESCENSASD